MPRRRLASRTLLVVWNLRHECWSRSAPPTILSDSGRGAAHSARSTLATIPAGVHLRNDALMSTSTTFSRTEASSPHQRAGCRHVSREPQPLEEFVPKTIGDCINLHGNTAA